jgi:biotin carboxyl carrier protein
MSIGYKVNVNDTFHFDLEKESVSQLDAVETDKSICLTKTLLSSGNHHLIFKKSYRQGKQQHLHTVAISNPLDILIKEMGFDRTYKQVNFIKAPMPGLIWKSVLWWEKVKENDNLIILER